MRFWIGFWMFLGPSWGPCGVPCGLRNATGTLPRRSKTLPRRSQDAPKTLKEPPQEAPRGPSRPPRSIFLPTWTPKRRPRRLKNRLRAAQEASRKRPTGALKPGDAQEWPQSCRKAPQTPLQTSILDHFGKDLIKILDHFKCIFEGLGKVHFG